MGNHFIKILNEWQKSMKKVLQKKETEEFEMEISILESIESKLTMDCKNLLNDIPIGSIDDQKIIEYKQFFETYNQNIIKYIQTYEEETITAEKLVKDIDSEIHKKKESIREINTLRYQIKNLNDQIDELKTENERKREIKKIDIQNNTKNKKIENHFSKKIEETTIKREEEKKLKLREQENRGFFYFFK